MAITQIGSEVFRTLSNGMKVSTRTEGNKIYTKLFDKDEKLDLFAETFEETFVDLVRKYSYTESCIF